MRRLRGFLRDNLPFSWRITIADNGSTDRTLEIACRLARELGGVNVLHSVLANAGQTFAAAGDTRPGGRAAIHVVTRACRADTVSASVTLYDCRGRAMAILQAARVQT